MPGIGKYILPMFKLSIFNGDFTQIIGVVDFESGRGHKIHHPYNLCY
jgi:hypothetical protein